MGFFERQAKGFGYFLTEDSIAARHPLRPEDLLRGVNGVRVRRDGTVLGTSYRACAVSVSIDGLVVSQGGPVRGTEEDVSTPQPRGGWTKLLHVDDIEAIEVYSRPGGVPAWLSGPVSPCGALVIWTKGSR